MTILEIRAVLGWCSVVNVGLMMVLFLLLSMARPWVYKMHSKWFPITESQFNMALYSFFGLYKALVFVFNIVPWIALSIVMG